MVSYLDFIFGIVGGNISGVISSLQAAIGASASAQLAMKAWFETVTGLSLDEMNATKVAFDISYGPMRLSDGMANKLANFYYNKDRNKKVGDLLDELTYGDGQNCLFKDDKKNDYDTERNRGSLMADIISFYGYTIDGYNRYYRSDGTEITYREITQEIEDQLNDEDYDKFHALARCTYPYHVEESLKKKQSIIEPGAGEKIGHLIGKGMSNLANLEIAKYKAIIEAGENLVDFVSMAGANAAKILYKNNQINALMAGKASNIDSTINEYNKDVDEKVGSFIANDYTSMLFNAFYNTPVGEFLNNNSSPGLESNGQYTELFKRISKTAGEVAVATFLPGGPLINGAIEGGATMQTLMQNPETADFEKASMASGVSFTSTTFTSAFRAKGVKNLANLPMLFKGWSLNPGFNLTAASVASNVAINSPYTVVTGGVAATPYIAQAAIEKIYGQDDSSSKGKARDAFFGSILSGNALAPIIGGLAGRATQNLVAENFANGFGYTLNPSVLNNNGDEVYIHGTGKNGDYLKLAWDPYGRFSYTYNPPPAQPVALTDGTGANLYEATGAAILPAGQSVSLIPGATPVDNTALTALSDTATNMVTTANAFGTLATLSIVNNMQKTVGGVPKINPQDFQALQKIFSTIALKGMTTGGTGSGGSTPVGGLSGSGGVTGSGRGRTLNLSFDPNTRKYYNNGKEIPAFEFLRLHYISEHFQNDA